MCSYTVGKDEEKESEHQDEASSMHLLYSILS